MYFKHIGTKHDIWHKFGIRDVRSRKHLLYKTQENLVRYFMRIFPALNEFIAAGRGIGVSSSQPNTSVSSVEQISNSCISSSSFDIPWWPERSLLKIAASGAKTRTWGDGYGYFLVATGRIEAMIDPPLYTYDVAPMLTIIPESGGRISSWDGKTELEDKIGWVATNGLIHDDLLGLLNS